MVRWWWTRKDTALSGNRDDLPNLRRDVFQLPDRPHPGESGSYGYFVGVERLFFSCELS
jgi:hypothetical protein